MKTRCMTETQGFADDICNCNQIHIEFCYFWIGSIKLAMEYGMKMTASK